MQRKSRVGGGGVRRWGCVVCMNFVHAFSPVKCVFTHLEWLLYLLCL